MQPSSETRNESPVQQLRAGQKGRVIAPGDADYDKARAVTYGGIDGHPAAIVRVIDAADVASVVTFARDNGFELAIRSGGHSAAGHSTTEGGIVLDLKDMKAIDIDVPNRRAWAETGITAAEFTSEVLDHGLVVGFGDAGTVALGGITTGGGVGYLARKYGLTIDSLLAAEIVTADGQLVRADANTNPDLFWAIRGGGGNFGVATRFQFQLRELTEFVGGLMVLPATAETIAGFVAAAEAAPEELSTIANVMNAPPMPFLPSGVVGQVVILAMIAYAGGAEAGARAIAPFRALATPLADMVKPSSYLEMFPPEDPDYHPTAVSRNLLVDHVDLDVAQVILDRLTACDASLRVAQLRVLGGAVARVPTDATAYAHRASKIMVNVAAFYDGPDDRPVRDAWVTEFADVLDQGDAGAYVNFVGDEGEARVRAAYPGATWERLTRIKARFDPTNLFRRNQNIPPAA